MTPEKKAQLAQVYNELQESRNLVSIVGQLIEEIKENKSMTIEQKSKFFPAIDLLTETLEELHQESKAKIQS